MLTLFAGRWTIAISSPPVRARRDHAQVGAGPVRPVNRFNHLAPPSGPGRWRTESAERGLQLELVPDPPDLADQRAVHVDARGGQVFAEGAAGQLTAELLLPPVVVLPAYA
jgi:hypothetical protein